MYIAHINLARGFRGGERQTALLIEQLAQKDVKQSLICRADSPLREMLKTVKNLDFHTANYFWSGHFGFQKADILHAHEAKAARWAWIENCLRKIPYIITRRVLNIPSKSALKIYSKATRIVAISNAIKTLLQEQIKGVDIAVIPSAFIDNQPHSETVAEIRAEFSGKTVIGHIGALTNDIKGQSYLIDAARSLEKQYPNLLFVFIGEGKDRAYLEQCAKGLDNIKFLGFKSNINDYICAFDLFVFPSLDEGLGSTLLDVMRLGVPIVASNIGGIVDIVHNRHNGVIIEPKNAEAIMHTITDFLHNRTQYEIYAKNGKIFVQNFAPKIMAESYYNIYNSVLENG